jgi:CheY-like chemotaxis protein
MFDDASQRRLDGVHVLVAEDDYLQCDGICSVITDVGASVVGPAHSLSEAHRLVISTSIDIAVVDINLGDGESFDFARILRSRSLPFIFATGYDCREIPTDFGQVTCLEKPFTDHALVSALVEAVSEARH